MSNKFVAQIEEKLSNELSRYSFRVILIPHLRAGWKPEDESVLDECGPQDLDKACNEMSKGVKTLLADGKLGRVMLMANDSDNDSADFCVKQIRIKDLLS